MFYLGQCFWVNLYLLSLDDVKITEQNAGKHIAVESDINSILASKNDTEGTCSVVESKVFPNGGHVSNIQTREYEGWEILIKI